MSLIDQAAQEPGYFSRSFESRQEELGYGVPTASVPRRITAGEVNTKPAGRKDDSGKLDMTLFDDMPLALEAVAEVMQWAITKKKPEPYKRGSWLGVSADRYRAAIMRHMSAANKQANAEVGVTHTAPNEQTDDETKLLHLAHVACSSLFALELTLRDMKSKYKA